jgi:antitoxin CptB
MTDALALARLRWRARRGLLENDLLMQKFFDQYGATLQDEDVRGMEALLELTDNELLELLLSRKELDASLDRPDVARVLHQLRSV